MRVTLDTNLFVYALSGVDGRRPVALSLVRRAGRADCIQPMQVFGELFAVLTGKYRRPVSEVVAVVDAYRTLMPTTTAEETDFDDAMRLSAARKVQFWDALIWAAARRAGSRVLFTEDMHDGQDLDGVKIVNPFNDANRALVDLVLPAAEQGHA